MYMPYRFDIHHFKLKLLWLNVLNADTKGKLRDKYPHFIAVLKIDIENMCLLFLWDQAGMSNSGGPMLAARNEDVMGCNFVV